MKHQCPNGKIIDLPDDATQSEIESIINIESPPENKPSLQMGKQAGGGSMAADIADSFLKNLPMVGSTIGSFVGSPGRVAGPVGTLLPVGLAAAGGGLGQAAENIIRRALDFRQNPQANNAWQTAAEQGTMEAAAPAAFRALGKIAAPFANIFKANPEGQALKALSEKEGLPLLPSAINPTRTAKAIEGAVDLFPTGKLASSYMQNKTYRWLLDTRQKVLDDMVGNVGGQGGTFARRAGDARLSTYEKSRQAYANITDSAGGENAIVPMESIQNYFKSLDNAPKKIQELINDFNARIASSGTPNGMTAKDLDEFLFKVSKEGKGYWQHLHPAINRDLEAFDQLGGKQLSNAWKMAQKENLNAKNFEYLVGIFQKYSQPAKGGGEVFQTRNFYQTIMMPSTQKYIQKNFGKTALDNLNDYAETVRRLGEATEGRDYGMGDVAKQAMAGSVLGMTLNPLTNPGLLVPYGVAPAVAYYITKPRSVFKEWLTSGLPAKYPETAKATKEALKVGGRAAISRKDEE